jgi:outer membrane protein assembly factor BamB
LAWKPGRGSKSIGLVLGLLAASLAIAGLAGASLLGDAGVPTDPDTVRPETVRVPSDAAPGSVNTSLTLDGPRLVDAATNATYEGRLTASNATLGVEFGQPFQRVTIRDHGTPLANATTDLHGHYTVNLTFQPGIYELQAVADRNTTRQATSDPIVTYAGPDWPQYAHDAQNRGTPNPHADHDNETLEEAWNRSLPARITTNPAIAYGQIYLGAEDGNVYALDADTGETVWRYEPDDSVDPVRATPVVAHGVVYVGLDFPIDPLRALDARTGEVQWTADLGGWSYIQASAAVGHGTVYAPFRPATLQAVDAANGTKQWDQNADKIRQPPTVADDTLYVPDFTKGVRALDAATGEQRWRVGGGTEGTPVVADGTVYAIYDRFRSQRNDLRAIDAQTGRIEWETEIRETSVSPGFHENRVYTEGPKAPLAAFNASTGEVVGSNDQLPFVSDPPVPQGDTLFVTGGDRVVTMDASTGEIQSTYQAPWQPLDIAVADGHAYITAPGGHVYALDVGAGMGS